MFLCATISDIISDIQETLFYLPVNCWGLGKGTPQASAQKRNLCLMWNCIPVIYCCLTIPFFPQSLAIYNYFTMLTDFVEIKKGHNMDGSSSSMILRPSVGMT